jgi:hypothetical protein
MCPDPTANPLRGYPVVIKPDGHPWGRCERLPEYVVIKVPGLPVGSVNIDHERTWRMAIDYAQVSADYVADSFVFTVSATRFNARTGEGKISLPVLVANKAERLLENWGATGISFADNAVTFSIRIADAYRTRAFWEGRDLTGLVFTDLSYDQGTGIHRVRIDYSVRVWADTEERDDFVEALAERAAVISHNTTTKRLTVDIARSRVRAEFQDEVRMRVESIVVRRRRYRAPESAVAVAEAAGGTLAVTQAEYQAAIIDQVSE